MLSSSVKHQLPNIKRQTSTAPETGAVDVLAGPHELQPHTYHCLFGLLAVSGLRLGEAVNLQPQDVDWSEGVLTIRGAKFGKTRLVPLHPSTLAVLRDYADLRDKIFTGRNVVDINEDVLRTEMGEQTIIQSPGVRRGIFAAIINEELDLGARS